jgi:hypothetical protein
MSEQKEEINSNLNSKDFDKDGDNADDFQRRKEMREATRTEYGLDGYDKDGYDKDGYDKDGKNPENIITISDEDKRRIKKFIPKRFATIQEFVTRAINVNASWEENPSTSMDTFAQKSPTIKQYDFLRHSMDPKLLEEKFPEYPAEFGKEWEEYEKNNTKKQQEETTDGNNFIQLKEKLTKSQEYVKKNYKNIIGDENEIKYDGWPLLFGHYSRIFPAQIGLHVLGNLMQKQDSTMINFDTFTKEAYKVAEEIANEYLEIERKDPTLKRVKKISIGLPKPYDEDEITSEQAIKEQRYKDRNFGKIKKTKDGNKTFVGLMSALGLVRVFENKSKSSITFSEEGKTMYLMENPIFKNTGDTAFSPKEQEFVINELISKRELETNLINVAKGIIEKKGGEDTIKDIEQSFQDEILKFAERGSDSNTSTRLKNIIKLTNEVIEKNLQNNNEVRKQTAIEAVRIATLGRMTELSMINWDADGKKSIYTIVD